MSYLFDFWPDHLLTKDDAERILKPYVDRLVRCWRDAWDEWESLPAETRGKLHPRDRAGVLHSLAISRAKLSFAEAAAVDVCMELGFFKLYIEDKIVLGLKRLGRDHLARNIKTKQQRRYDWHYPVPGIRNALTRLTAGYVLDA